MAGFKANFGISGMILSLSAIMILFYFGLANPNLFETLWVAFAFWITGFVGSIYLGLVGRTKGLSFNHLLRMGAYTACGLLVFAGFNYSYAILMQASVTGVSSMLMSWAIGISEELFFGVFALGALTSMMGLPRLFAIILTSASHALYHVPTWGMNPSLLILFFFCFAVARSLYVYVFPHVGMLLGIHGFWNLGVA